MQAPCGGGERSDHSFGVRVLSSAAFAAIYLACIYVDETGRREGERGKKRFHAGLLLHPLTMLVLERSKIDAPDSLQCNHTGNSLLIYSSRL